MSEPITVLPRVAESEALKHSVDFTDELAGDTISTRTSQDVDTGLTVDQFSHSGAVVTFTVTPAAATAGKSLNFTVQLTTAGSQTIRRRFLVPVVQHR